MRKYAPVVQKMTKTQNKLFQDYADKKAEAGRIAEELKELETGVLGLLEKQGVDTLKETYGTFSVVYRKSWEYSPALVQKELEYNTIIKASKSEEQESGVAKAEETKGLSYRAYKPNG